MGLCVRSANSIRLDQIGRASASDSAEDRTQLGCGLPKKFQLQKGEQNLAPLLLPAAAPSHPDAWAMPCISIGPVRPIVGIAIVWLIVSVAVRPVVRPIVGVAIIVGPIVSVAVRPVVRPVDVVPVNAV